VSLPDPDIQISFAPIHCPPRRLKATWSVTGSTIVMGPDRTGQLVRHADDSEVFLVRETASDESGRWHTLVDPSNQELNLTEEDFWPWGSWENLV
jgi:hypothetical protein